MWSLCGVATLRRAGETAAQGTAEDASAAEAALAGHGGGLGAPAGGGAPPQGSRAPQKVPPARRGQCRQCPQGEQAAPQVQRAGPAARTDGAEHLQCRWVGASVGKFLLRLHFFVGDTVADGKG